MLDFLTEKIKTRKAKKSVSTGVATSNACDTAVSSCSDSNVVAPISDSVSVSVAPSYSSSGVVVNSSAAPCYSPVSTMYGSSNTYPVPYVANASAGYQAPFDVHRQAPLVASSYGYVHRAPLGAYPQVPLARTSQQAPFAVPTQAPLVSAIPYVHQAPLGVNQLAPPVTYSSASASRALLDTSGRAQLVSNAPEFNTQASLETTRPQAQFVTSPAANTQTLLEIPVPLSQLVATNPLYSAQASLVSRPVCRPPTYDGSTDLAVLFE